MDIEELLKKIESPSENDDIVILTDLFYEKIKRLPNSQKEALKARYQLIIMEKISEMWENMESI